MKLLCVISKRTSATSRSALRIILLMLALSLSCFHLAGAGYSVVDLGTLGGNYSLGYGINNFGSVAGESDTTNTLTHGFIYRAGTMSDLSSFVFGQFYSTARGINNSNQVVGQAAMAGFYRAFLASGTNRTDLGTLGGDYSFAYGVNDSTQIVGESTLSAANGGLTHAFLRTGVTMNDIGTLGGNYSSAFAINNSGHVVGESNTTNNVTHAFYYNGSMSDLGTLGGQESSGSAINSFDEVVGYALTSASVSHAFIHTNGAMFDLGNLMGLESAANAVNNKGHVVGYFTFSTGTSTNTHAFLFDGETMYDLNNFLPAASGWELTSAQGINDLGQITGYGQINGQTHAFLLTPTLTFVSPQLLGDGKFQVTLEGGAGQNWEIQGSIDLTNWTLLNTVTLGPVNFIDTNANNFGYRFYRGVLVR